MNLRLTQTGWCYIMCKGIICCTSRWLQNLHLCNSDVIMHAREMHMNIFNRVYSVVMHGKCSDRHNLCQPSDVEDTKPRRVLWVAATASPAWASPRLWLHWIPLWRTYTYQPPRPPRPFLPPCTLFSSYLFFPTDLMCYFFQKFILFAPPCTAARRHTHTQHTRSTPCTPWPP